ncbi:MAG: AAA family ATPase [Sedimentisphaerales bacterium]|nr:AAA family ATPase [Sedimentisphaerales bacterium]
MSLSSSADSFHRLQSVSVIGGFLDGQRFDLSDGLNCVIGARGTGKTTVLEFVRYAMDALPADGAARRRVESLVEQNLAGGRIEVAVRTKDGLSYVVSRSAGDEPVVLDEHRNPTDISLRSGGLFKVDIFSQNEVEAIADQASSQLDLIDNFEADRIADIEHRIRTLKADLAANASKITPLQQKADAIGDELNALGNVNEKLKAFKTEGGDDADAINQAHGLKALRDRERRAVGATNDLLTELYRAIEANVGHIGQRLATIFTEDMLKGPNGALVEEMRLGLQTCSDDVDRLLRDALERIRAEGETVAAKSGKLDLAHKQQDLKFQELIEKHKEAQGKAAERHRLEKLRNDLLAKQRERDQLLEQLKALRDERTRLLRQLSELRDERFGVRQTIVDRINAALSPSIKASIIQFGNPEEYRALLEEALKDNRLRRNVVAGKVANAFWPAELAEAIKQRDTQALIDKAELNADQADKVMAAMVGSQVLFDLETVELIDLPKIELNDNGTLKETGALSTGQKCTTILPILLMDSENPLLIDQPEDNLDNRFVFETIVESIGKIKRRRQLIFVTHNPNIPVLGDADKVFVMDSDGTTARKVNEGTVDHCKDNIVTLLEGGEDAFKRRKARYSY